MERFAIAIDGPAGSGKSTVAKAVAKRLGIIYVDTGAMYRTVALYCMEHGISMEDEAAVVAALDEMQMKLLPQEEGQRIFLNGQDVTGEIRTPQIGRGASVVGAYQQVRERMVELQQAMAQEQSVIMDGRDIGTVVLPQAEVKIYLDAGVEERTKRRMGELEAQGKQEKAGDIRESILRRDENDMNRKHSPLRRAEDAVLLDSTGMSVEEVTARVLEIAARKKK